MCVRGRPFLISRSVCILIPWLCLSPLLPHITYSSVVVINPMSKGPHRRGFNWANGSRWVRVWHGREACSKQRVYSLSYKKKAKRKKKKNCMQDKALCSPKATADDVLPPGKPSLLNLPNTATHWRPGIQTLETMEEILMKASTLRMGIILTGSVSFLIVLLFHHCWPTAQSFHLLPCLLCPFSCPFRTTQTTFLFQIQCRHHYLQLLIPSKHAPCQL